VTTKVVIDTQVFLRAAINRNSLAGRVVFDLREHYTLVTSSQIVAEVTDVLNRPKLRIKFAALTDSHPDIEEVIAWIP
jgi:putative PIN family toxin of toxin-antitoxin system